MNIHEAFVFISFNIFSDYFKMFIHHHLKFRDKKSKNRISLIIIKTNVIPPNANTIVNYNITKGYVE